MRGRSRPSATAPRERSSNRRRSSAGYCDLCCGSPESGPAIWRAPAPSPGRSGDADELKFDVERLAVEWLHHIFVGARFERRADMRHVVFSCAEHDLRLIAVTALAKQPQEIHATHDWHVPVKQNDVGHLGFAPGQRFLTVAGFLDLKLERFEDVPRDFADHLGIIDDQTTLHMFGFPLPVSNLLNVKGNEELKLR